MKHSTDRILIAHAGSLLRPLALQSSWYRLWLLPTGVEPKAPPVYRREALSESAKIANKQLFA